MPHGKVGAKTWWANDATARNAIGSDHGLEVNSIIALDDGTRHRCTAVTGGLTSTWVAVADSGLPATLALDPTTGANDIIVDGGQQIIGAAGNDLNLAGAPGFSVAITTALTVALAATLSGNVTLDATSAILQQGDGITAGSPEFRLLKGPTGLGTFTFFDTDTTPSTADFQLAHSTGENWSVARHDGVAFRDMLLLVDDTDLRVMSGAQAAALLTLGNPSFATGDEAVLLLLGGATSEPAIQFFDPDNAITFDVLNGQFEWSVGGGQEMVLSSTTLTLPGNNLTMGGTSPVLTMGDGVTAGTPQHNFIKGPTGSTVVNFFDTDAAASVTDYRIQHNTAEDWLLEYHDGVAFRHTMIVRSDANVQIMGQAQAAASLAVGNSGFSTADEAVILLHGGATSTPGIQFIDSGNQLVFTEAGQRYDLRIAGTDFLRVEPTNLVLLHTSSLFQMGDGVTTGSPTFNILKGPTGESAIAFFQTNTSPSLGDAKFTHDSGEILALFHHDGADYRNVQQWTSDAAMDLLGEAQASATVTVGNSAFASGDEANILLLGGATGLPTLQFEDGTNRLRYDIGASRFAFLIGNAEVFRLTATVGLELLDASAELHVGPAASYEHDQAVWADSTTNVTNKNYPILAEPYTSADGQWRAMNVFSGVANNILYLGGQGGVEGSTEITFVTSATVNANGTERGTIENDGLFNWVGDIRAAGILVDGDSGGTAGTLTLTNVVDGVTGGPLTVADHATLTLNHTGWKKEYDETGTHYVPVFTD